MTVSVRLGVRSGRRDMIPSQEWVLIAGHDGCWHDAKANGAIMPDRATRGAPVACLAAHPGFRV